ncbi:MAG: hypothetical protein HQK51_15665 [Oligoflexia bacterium]|nr:hypothetical protein [Oligoflexia bacterium]
MKKFLFFLCVLLSSFSFANDGISSDQKITDAFNHLTVEQQFFIEDYFNDYLTDENVENICNQFESENACKSYIFQNFFENYNLEFSNKGIGETIIREVIVGVIHEIITRVAEKIAKPDPKPEKPDPKPTPTPDH